MITLAILRIVWQSAKAVFARALDGVDPDVVEEIRHAVEHVPGVRDVTETRVRWIGHRLYAELNVAVDSSAHGGRRAQGRGGGATPAPPPASVSLRCHDPHRPDLGIRAGVPSHNEHRHGKLPPHSH